MSPVPRSGARLRRVAGVPVLLLVLALTVSSCALSLLGDDEGSSSPQESASAMPSPSPLPSSSSSQAGAPKPGLERYYTQQVDWQSCRSGMKCTDIEVPLDYAHPGGKTLKLAVLKVPATDPDSRVGSLVVNPGGPGASGVDYAARADTFFGDALRKHFDVVGFDPRGVGSSDPVNCVSDAQLDEFVAADPDPDTAAERQQAADELRTLGDGCLDNSDGIARHMSTNEAARDIDVLRAVLGDKRLSYFGASYGTFLGATYAQEFPERVGRMVLDGALDPSLSNEKLNLAQAKGFETALRAYVGACVDRGSCFLGGSVDAGIARIQQFLGRMEKQPIQVGNRTLTEGTAVLGIWAPLYNKDNWRYLDAALQQAFNGDGQVLLSLSDAYTSRGPDGYTDNSIEALYAVNCLDNSQSIPFSKVPSHFGEFERASPTFGRIFAFGLSSCATWPVPSKRTPAPIHAPGAAPILVVGTTRDPATPYRWAKALASQLKSGVLLTRDGDGHTGYRAGNECVDRTVEDYLVSGAVPDSGKRC